MELTQGQLNEMIDRAEAAGACREAIAELRGLPPGDYSEHPRAPRWAGWYANRVCFGRWYEAESIIKRDPCAAYCYARWVIGGRWPDGEDAISSHPYFLRLYKKLPGAAFPS